MLFLCYILLLGKQQFQSQDYALFTLTDKGFTVTPCHKHYTFLKKPKHHILSIDEAEAQMSRVDNGSRRWMMTKSIKEDQEKESSNPKVKKEQRQNMNGEDEGQDYDEDFQDDDGLIELGIDDEEESKEVNQRLTNI